MSDCKGNPVWRRYTDRASELVRNMIKSVDFPKMTNTL